MYRQIFMTTRSLLIVDDNSSILTFCGKELKKAGYRVRLSQQATEVLDVLREETFDLVVLDIHMPRMSGLDLAGQIRERHPHMPIVFHTANALTDDDPRIHLANACVEKSDDLQQLKETIAQILLPHAKQLLADHKAVKTRPA